MVLRGTSILIVGIRAAVAKGSNSLYIYSVWMTNSNTYQAGFRSQARPIGFMIEKVALGYIFLRVHGFSSVHYHSTIASFLFPWRNSLPVGQGLLFTEASRSHSDTPQSVGLLSASDLPDAEPPTWQHAKTQQPQQTTVYTPGGIRNRNSSNRAAADPRLIAQSLGLES